VIAKTSKVFILAAMSVALILSVVGCGSSAETTTTAANKLDKLTLVAPPGPMAIPMV
jgi:ABC-type Zn uptake system ZnuABC Zn-binding protein ZnuA